jgi:hypothetical protein
MQLFQLEHVGLGPSLTVDLRLDAWLHDHHREEFYWHKVLSVQMNFSYVPLVFLLLRFFPISQSPTHLPALPRSQPTAVPRTERFLLLRGPSVWA